MKTKQHYVRGVKAKKPQSNAPIFAVTNISVRLDSFLETAKKYVNADGFVNLEIKENDKNEHYVVYSDYFHKDQIAKIDAEEAAKNPATTFNDSEFFPPESIK